MFCYHFEEKHSVSCWQIFHPRSCLEVNNLVKWKWSSLCKRKNISIWFLQLHHAPRICKNFSLSVTFIYELTRWKLLLQMDILFIVYDSWKNCMKNCNCCIASILEFQRSSSDSFLHSTLIPFFTSIHYVLCKAGKFLNQELILPK